MGAYEAQAFTGGVLPRKLEGSLYSGFVREQ
jgi:hypothetical protein